MDYSRFKEKAILEDGRNRFGNAQPIGLVPMQLTDFFAACNPVDVEVYYPGIGSVRFYGVSELTELQKDYALMRGDFVFATTNGDPIFLHEGKVCMSAHGVCKPEYLADSFDDFLAKYL